jgi:hypothetical protein
MKVEICVPFRGLYQLAIGEATYAMAPVLYEVLAEHGLYESCVNHQNLTGGIVRRSDCHEIVWELDLPEEE